MNTPDIKYYALFADVTNGKKTPKYKVVKQAGYYPPMEALVGRDGKISVYLMTSKDSGSIKDNAPAMKLQAKNSLNFTGLKEYFVDGGKLSGVAYGYPLDKPTYGKDNKPNPFYECKDDCFLFKMHTDSQSVKPTAIEIIVLAGAKVLGASYCKQLLVGGFDDVLTALRQQAK